MRYETLPTERVLGIAPMRAGFGFAVIENNGRIQVLDWGTALCNRRNHDSCFHAVERLLDRYAPTSLVMEDSSTSLDSRRKDVLTEFHGRIDPIFDNGVPCVRYSRLDVRAAFSSSGAVTKYEIAEVLVATFPELAPRLPRRREVWQSEDKRMSIFDAIALALVHLGAPRAQRPS